MFNSTFLFMKIEFFIFTTQQKIKIKTVNFTFRNNKKKIKNHLIFVIYVILDTKSMKHFFK